MKTLSRIAVGAMIVAALATSSAAEEYPSRPIEVVTHASAGGGTDTTARTMLIRARKELGVDAFVQIKKGGGGAVAMSYASGKPADGHTLMAITPTHLITMARGRAPIGIDHIAAMTFANNSGAKVAYVPFDGGGAMITNLMGKNIQAAGLNYGEAVDGIESGDFVPLAIMAQERLGVLPDTPTMAELGIDGVNFSTVRGVIVMADTPEDRATMLEEKLIKGMEHGTYQAYLEGIGLDAGSVAGSEVWDAQIREMYDNIYATLEELGLRK